VFAALLFGILTLINNVLHDGLEPRLAISVAMPLCLAQTVVMFALLPSLRGGGGSASKSALRLTRAGLVFMLLAGFAVGAGLPWYIRKPSITNLVYGSHEKQRLDIFLPRDKPGEVDVLLYIHGGGLTAGDKETGANICLDFKRNGCVAAAMNYRLTTFLAPPEEQEVSYMDMLDDIDAAISALKAKLIQRGYTPRKMAITGESAGGHLTLLYGCSRFEQSPIPIAFLFPDVAPTDFYDPGYLSLPYGPAIAEHGCRLTNDSASDLKVLSPMFYIGPQVPPVLMRYGAIDELVPLSQGVLLKASLDAAGIRNDMFVYQNSGHGLDGPDGETNASYRAKLSEYVEEYF
jgi:acetyl esterase/lipase